MLQENQTQEDLILKNPFQTILGWVENHLKFAGLKVFPNLALQPVSLIVPPFYVNADLIRPNIHTLLLAPSGAGKSKVAELFSRITINPFPFEYITDARFYSEVKARKDASFVVSDVTKIFKDRLIVKTLENAIGDEKMISKQTMRETTLLDVNATMLGCGLPQALTKYITEGLLQRMTPIIMFHTEDEKREIGEWIISNIGNKTENGEVELKIKRYYKFLYDIQKGKIDDHKPITGWLIDELFKHKIGAEWKLMQDKVVYPPDTYIWRDLHSGFRVLCASAMLNLFDRKIEENGKERLLVPNQYDLSLALNMMDSEMKTRYRILALLQKYSETNDIISLYSHITNSDEYDSMTKHISRIFLEAKLGNRLPKILPR